MKRKADNVLQKTQQFMAPRFNDGYVKGIHDQDAAKILEALVQISEASGLLRYPSRERACAALYWHQFAKPEIKKLLNHRLKGAGTILEVFPQTHEFDDLIAEIQKEIEGLKKETGLFGESSTSRAAEYLFHELASDDDFVVGKEAAELYKTFLSYLEDNKAQKRYEDSVKALEDSAVARYRLILKWVQAFVEAAGKPHWRDYLDEVATLLHTGIFEETRVLQADLKQELSGMNGSHSLIKNGNYLLDFSKFQEKMQAFEGRTVPLFEQLAKMKKTLTARFREELRLEEFRPRVLTSFVRNRLIDQVYLPLIGNNLAKQIGSAGENKRTDNMGMLLLISPPGYGKTTLMEYIANRLGIIFMKINGPAIGHGVTSLDPAEAPNATAREELEKLNLALEMGNNVMIYLDDIQHCNPEFLQKFISLCDAQRKIEGVYKGRSKTYDLRGKKVCVVMAGNPYTESGAKFRIPDMLANRADIYNLGDIIGESDEAFKLSYIENSMTSNEVLRRLSSKSPHDIYAMIRLAQSGSREGLEFEASHSPEEMNECVAVLQKLIVVRDVVLHVNQEYIRSAGQHDDYRTEPPFRLQGSYRDMNKMAEKIQPITNDSELQNIILTHYTQEAQTLTTGAEANILKFKEMMSRLKPEEEKRWEEIKQTFRKNNKLRGIGTDNQVGQVLAQMEGISDGLKAIADAVKKS